MKYNSNRSIRDLGRIALTAIMLLVLPVAGFAQQTTSSIQGSVNDPNGNPVAGAQITVTHMGTGITASRQTNSAGTYRVTGLRVGGPYVATLARSSSYGEDRIEQIYISLSEPYVLNLVTRVTAIEEIVVSASQQDTFFRIGAASNFDSENIDGQANANRDFKNIVTQDPRVIIDYTNQNAISIAGTNNRMNSLTVDGVRQNDDFGLNNSGFPTQRAPISIDAIAQMSVETSPFDVSFGGFTGGTINAVTRSGTNEWDGSITVLHSDDSLHGDKTENDTVSLGLFDEDTIAATIGGPIIKDKLWLFASYEEWTGTDTQSLRFGPAGSGRDIEISEVTQQDLDDVLALSNSVYGFDAGALPNAGKDIKSETLLVKLDWALADDHTLSVTYQDVIGNTLVPQGNSTYNNQIGLTSNWYDRSEDFKSVSAQLFSTWTDAFSTEIKIASQERLTGQNSLSGTDLAQMTIDTLGGGAVRVGADEYRHSNELGNDQFQWKIKGDYLWNDHTISAGLERDSLDIFNVFNPGSNGLYEFDCIFTIDCVNSYEGRQAATLDYSNAFSNVKSDAAAAFEYQVNSFYIQDIWDVTDQLTIQYGLRYDWYTSDDTPRENANFQARHGFSNTESLDGRNIAMPRVGFVYDFDSGTRLRGGIGLFSGGNPGVWISNSYSNDGVTIVVPDDAGAVNAACAGVSSSPAALSNVDARNVAQAVQDCMFSGAGDVELTDPGFDIPASWKYNLAVEHEFDFGPLGDGWNVTAEAVLSDVSQAVEWIDLARTQINTAPDGRPIYDRPPVYDVMLTNTDKGSANTFSLSLDKAWDTRAGLFGMTLHYTRMDAEDVNPGQSSTVSSNYGRPATFDRNNRQLSTSDFEIKDRINGTLDWSKDLFGDNVTRASLFFEYRSGKPYSYTMREGSGDSSVWGGDTTFSRRDSQLMYVPTLGDAGVIFNNTPGALVNDPVVEADFNAFITAAGLDGARGTILARNFRETSSATRFNLRLQQEVGLFDMPGVGETKLHLFLDVENIGNLLNDDWGRVEQVSFPFNYTAVDEVSLNANGQYVYGSGSTGSTFDDATDPSSFFGRQSVYKIQLGAKFQF
ncbi:MAG: TonB-dependent receptor [Proteobacteria bacterium]|nr:TonB-dependent receptor [Pseudomonadota bacterium]